MPTFENGDAEIYCEEFGHGYPLFTFAPGALRSQIAFWHHSPARTSWAAASARRLRCAGATKRRNGSAHLHDTDFTFSVSRADVARMKMPLLVMPADEGPHPTAIGEEIARLAPHAEVLMNWKAPNYLDDAIRAVTGFLERNTPALV